jgi:hypothetical protein
VKGPVQQPTRMTNRDEDDIISSLFILHFAVRISRAIVETHRHLCLKIRTLLGDFIFSHDKFDNAEASKFYSRIRPLLALEILSF